MKHRIAVAVASVVLSLGGLIATQAGAANRTVSASGDSMMFTATVSNAKTFSWSSRPSIPGFTTTVRCKTGNVARSARFRANNSTSVKGYAITLTLRGHGTAADHWKVTQGGSTNTTTTTLPQSCIVPTCSLTFSAPDTYGSTILVIGGVLQNVANPDPIFATPVGDQLDAVSVGMSTGPTGMSDPGAEVYNFALALAGGGQGTIDSITFDSSMPYAMGALGPVAPSSSFGANIYFDVPVGSNWSSVNFRLNFTNVYAVLP